MACCIFFRVRMWSVDRNWLVPLVGNILLNEKTWQFNKKMVHEWTWGSCDLACWCFGHVYNTSCHSPICMIKKLSLDQPHFFSTNNSRNYSGELTLFLLFSLYRCICVIDAHRNVTSTLFGLLAFDTFWKFSFCSLHYNSFRMVKKLAKSSVQMLNAWRRPWKHYTSESSQVFSFYLNFCWRSGSREIYQVDSNSRCYLFRLQSFISFIRNISFYFSS